MIHTDLTAGYKLSICFQDDSKIRPHLKLLKCGANTDTNNQWKPTYSVQSVSINSHPGCNSTLLKLKSRDYNLRNCSFTTFGAWPRNTTRKSTTGITVYCRIFSVVVLYLFISNVVPVWPWMHHPLAPALWRPVDKRSLFFEGVNKKEGLAPVLSTFSARSPWSIGLRSGRNSFTWKLSCCHILEPLLCMSSIALIHCCPLPHTLTEHRGRKCRGWGSLLL